MRQKIDSEIRWLFLTGSVYVDIACDGYCANDSCGKNDKVHETQSRKCGGQNTAARKQIKILERWNKATTAAKKKR